MESVETYQKRLLEQTQYLYYETPISSATQKAFFDTPRHRFIRRYRQWGIREWHEVRQDNLEQHLAMLYADRALVLFGDNDEDIPSTISQPSFVLRMLDMLQLEPGQTVFELGAGSGWNAALMGRLVGAQGRVYSLELIPEVARSASEAVEALGIMNVRVIQGDGGEGYPAGAPYDRAIFTAGTYDLPRPFFEQMTEGGLMLAVIKNEGGGDTLFLLRKKGEHFESLDAMPCGFVQMRGKYKVDSLEPIQIESLPGWKELQQQANRPRPFWWGGKGKVGFAWRTLGIRSFLSISEPSFRAFRTERKDDRSRDENYFGLWVEGQNSLVIARDDFLYSYGSPLAEERLLHSLDRWVKLGMPGAASFTLQIHPIDRPVTVGENEWLVKRRESQFLWSLRI